MSNSENKRIDELEAKSVFQEDTIEKLSKELRIQQQEIQILKDQIISLKRALEMNFFEAKNEKPPHY